MIVIYGTRHYGVVDERARVVIEKDHIVSGERGRQLRSGVDTPPERVDAARVGGVVHRLG